MYHVRAALPEDAPELARVHVSSWHTTYRGLLPQNVLDGQTVEARTQNWHAILTARVDQGFVYLAEQSGPENLPPKVVGLACGGFERTNHKVYDGELYAIYLLESVQRQGVGRMLVHTVTGRLVSDGYKGMLVWVLRENPARAFYEALGGEYLYEMQISIGPVDVIEVAYGWKDLRDLVARTSHGDPIRGQD